MLARTIANIPHDVKLLVDNHAVNYFAILSLKHLSNLKIFYSTKDKSSWLANGFLFFVAVLRELFSNFSQHFLILQNGVFLGIGNERFIQMIIPEKYCKQSAKEMQQLCSFFWNSFVFGDWGERMLRNFINIFFVI